MIALNANDETKTTIASRDADLRSAEVRFEEISEEFKKLSKSIEDSGLTEGDPGEGGSRRPRNILNNLRLLYKPM